MKINVDRLYTYPVLAEGRDDYKTCKFSAKVNYFSDATDNLVLDVDFSTNCAEIKNLIADGKAEYLLHTECQLTALRKNFTSAAEKLSCKIPVNSVKQNLECLALIVLTEDLKNFSCKDWSEDFDWLKFDLKKGNVLAYQNFQPLPFPDDPNILKNVASIFSIYKRPVDDEPFEVDLSQNKIKIGLSKKDYLLYRRYSSSPDMQPILNAMIIFPALVYVFAELQAYEDFNPYGSTDWFLSLKAAYRRKKINMAEYIDMEENTPIKLAQEVMNLPTTKTLESIRHNDAAEDS